MAEKFIEQAPGGEITAPDGTEQVPVSKGVQDYFVQIQNWIARKLRETGGPTTLNMGAIADNEAFIRSGTNIIGKRLRYPVFTRCSVQSGVPNPTSDLLAQTAIYVMPYGGGNTYPQWDGSDFIQQQFSEQTLTLNAAHTADSIYDIYLWNDNGTQRVVTGPAWASATSRGTGAGTAQVTDVNGVTVNAVAMTVRNGANTFSMPAQRGTVVGTFVASANGQVEWSAKYRGLYNFYNQLDCGLHICPGYNNDAAATSYSINSTTWVEANGGVGSRIKFVLGKPTKVNFLAAGRFAAASGGTASMAVGIDMTTNPVVSTTANLTTLNTYALVETNKGVPLAIGSHFAALLFFYATAGPFTVFADNGNRGGALADLETTYVDGSILM